MDAITTDTFFDGRLRVKQHKGGYRFSIDAVLVAHYANPHAGDHVLDLGTGCGIIPLLMCYRHSDTRVVAVEIQPELAQLAQLNVVENRMTEQIEVVCKDLRALCLDDVSGPVDLVISNPPYRKPHSGRINPDPERAVARHELKARLADVIQTAGRLLRRSGRLVVVYAAERSTDLLVQMRSFGIEPKRLRFIHSAEASAAKLVLVEGVNGGRSTVKVDPPLVVYTASGQYTEEVLQIFRP
jgi:tRNA1Val (adenine37-N6)-methyltransferase